MEIAYRVREVIHELFEMRCTFEWSETGKLIVKYPKYLEGEVLNLSRWLFNNPASAEMVLRQYGLIPRR